LVQKRVIGISGVHGCEQPMSFTSLSEKEPVRNIRHFGSGVSQDGTTCLWNAKTGQQCCRLISQNYQQEWLVVTPEGLFDGSRARRKKAAFRIGKGRTVVPLDRFFQDAYYPGLLAAIWRGERPRPGKPFAPSPRESILQLGCRAEPDG
jgi:hypothetical protein